MSSRRPHAPKFALVGVALLTLGVGGSATGVRADALFVMGDTITLGTLLPALSGTDLGELSIAPAPLPGETSVVHGSDIRAKLTQAGQDARGLAIPRSTRVSRRAQTLSADDLRIRVSDALLPMIAPCSVESLSSFSPVTLGEGTYDLSVDAIPRRSSGRTSFSMTLRQGERSQHLHGQVAMSCPPPVIAPGATVQLTVKSGPVKVTAPATAQQPGRVGDEIRVTNQLNRQSYRARVVDAATVELLR